MTISSRMIVLNVTKLGEGSIVLHTISREWGRRSFVVKVGRGSSMSMFLPMNILEADVTENPRSSLWRASHITACHPLGGIRNNLHKNTITLFMSEVLYRAIRGEAREDGLYEWCERSILTLDAMESDFANFHLRFLLELAVTMGFSPSAADIAPFAGEYAQTLMQFLQSSFAESMLIPLNGAARNDMAEIILRYISHHSESAINVQSLKVLRELYS